MPDSPTTKLTKRFRQWFGSRVESAGSQSLDAFNPSAASLAAVSNQPVLNPMLSMSGRLSGLVTVSNQLVVKPDASSITNDRSLGTESDQRVVKPARHELLDVVVW